MADETWQESSRDGWTVRLLIGELGFSGLVDAEAIEADGTVWVGTAGSLSAVAEIMDRYRQTGECLSGRYFWSSGLVITRDDSAEDVFDVVFSLVDSGELQSCFERVGEDLTPPETSD